MTISWALRTSVRSPDKNRFFANCWLMVEPPTTLTGRVSRLFLALAARCAARSSALLFFDQAFSNAAQSMPSWLAKLSSSEAITARLSAWPSCASVCQRWLQRTLPCSCSWRQTCERSKLLDCGSTQAMAAMRSAKYSCKPSSAKHNTPSNRNKAIRQAPRLGSARLRRR